MFAFHTDQEKELTYPQVLRYATFVVNDDDEAVDEDEEEEEEEEDEDDDVAIEKISYYSGCNNTLYHIEFTWYSTSIFKCN